MHLRGASSKIGLLLGLGTLAAGTPATAQFSQSVEKATMHLEADRLSYESDSAARLAALVSIDPGWHTNSNTPTFEYLIGTRLEVSLPAGWGPPVFSYPEGEMKTFAFADQPISVYEGQVPIFADFKIPADAVEGTHILVAELTYQACDDRSCLPPVTTTSKVEIEVGSEGASTGLVAPVNAPVPPNPPTGKSIPILSMILAGLLGGLILNAMPCVLPVLSLKIFGLVESASKSRRQVVVGSLATAAGILVSFWALAAGAIVVKAAGGAIGWGVQFQQPVFVVMLAIIVVLFCLNLWGVFEIRLPHRVAGIAGTGPNEGLPGHFASGLFATLMATPCSAPFLGSAVGFALSQKSLTILIIFTAIATGMALPYLLLAIFPEASGWLPKPGPWMNQLRVVLGFLLAAAAVWLFYVLAAQMSRERVAFIELGVLSMALLVYLRGHVSPGKVFKTVLTVATVVCIGLTLALAAQPAALASTLSSQKTTKLIPWVDFDRAEAAQLARDGRMVFVDVTADWCFTCKVNERLVLETEAVAAAFENHRVVPMKADWTNRSDSITEFLADHGRYGIPFYLLYRPGAEPYLFGELLTIEAVTQVIEDSAAERAR